ncbi:hypothetical protein TREMEDRAFT_64062 [Tremella mesenterica DSM 1558]|uniref:uncharacterized protein n=1 Tax=Tremella mesenterica (strain ATCC 24925 / CBS 8224 / DSM 1558 / NBRC 9311 / NRRL Y-6157 / RJB 2259-6 / UBC 559-6) TaxID=578456 RepID=UPI0003F4A56E|nr:uncharacterized protein TREMEDRAFT_64062 [Tremella mesenterica DSM 1558]EIW67470.1 hypothetical protein TREMEDRAFT_64062 [Tremella mesenterica DSM 1558]
MLDNFDPEKELYNSLLLNSFGLKSFHLIPQSSKLSQSNISHDKLLLSKNASTTPLMYEVNGKNSEGITTKVYEKWEYNLGMARAKVVLLDLVNIYHDHRDQIVLTGVVDESGEKEKTTLTGIVDESGEKERTALSGIMDESREKEKEKDDLSSIKVEVSVEKKNDVLIHSDIVEESVHKEKKESNRNIKIENESREVKEDEVLHKKREVSNESERGECIGVGVQKGGKTIIIHLDSKGYSEQE